MIFDCQLVGTHPGLNELISICTIVWIMKVWGCLAINSSIIVLVQNADFRSTIRLFFFYRLTD